MKICIEVAYGEGKKKSGWLALGWSKQCGVLSVSTSGLGKLAGTVAYFMSMIGLIVKQIFVSICECIHRVTSCSPKTLPYQNFSYRCLT